MRFLNLLPTLLLGALATGVVPARADVLITVDKSTQRMSVSVDGQPLYAWRVSTGRSGHATPAGAFTPFRLDKDHRSKEWDDAPMPYSIFFTGQGHAIHGSNATRQLGSPASHGCIRLAPSKAAKLFALVKSEGLGNTRIVVRGDESIIAARTGSRARHARAARTFERRYTGLTSQDPSGGWAVEDAPDYGFGQELDTSAIFDWR